MNALNKGLRPAAKRDGLIQGGNDVVTASGVGFGHDSAPAVNHVRDHKHNTLVMEDPCPITDVRTIAERLIEVRTELNLSQAEFAERAGVSQGTIGNIESGHRKSPREILAIAAAGGVRPEWLKDGRGPKFPGATGEPPAAAPAVPFGVRLHELGELAQSRPHEVRVQLAQLVSMVIVNGPSKALCAAADEVMSHGTAEASAARTADRDPSAEWESQMKKMAADLQPDQLGKFLTLIGEIKDHLTPTPPAKPTLASRKTSGPQKRRAQ